MRDCVTINPTNRVTFAASTHFVPLVIKNNSSIKKVSFKILVNNEILHPTRPNIGVIEAGASAKINLLYTPVKTLLNVEESVYKVIVAFTELDKAELAEIKTFWDGVQEADQHEFQLPVSLSAEPSIEDFDIKTAYNEY